MKNRVFNAFLLLAMVGMMFTACKKEYPEPPIQDLPIGTVYTIDEILAMEPGTVFTDDASVYGIITADEVSGNLYKAAFMQDRATGAAIELYLNAVSGVRIGDSVRIYLKDVTYAMYNNLPQLSNFEADGHIVILANNKPIEPEVTTIADVNAGNHLAQLIRLENVRFTEQNTFADPTTYGNRTLADPTDYSQTVIVRTSNYANFANDSLPQGTGNLVAIASVYNSTWQLYIRSASELEFDGYTPGGDNGLPYYQDFTNTFGTYTTYNVAGEQEWKLDYNTAAITGHVQISGEHYYYPNEDWLISAPVALTGVDHVKVGVNYAAQYTNSNTEDVTLHVSKDYVAGTDPLTANWTQIPVTYPNTSGWSDFQTVENSLDDFLGETVTVAIKFTSSETQSRTFEVKYILIQEGVPGVGPTPPDPGTGGELQNMPYTQSFTQAFGTYMAYNVLGSQIWVIDHNAATMSGYSGSSYANEDWLISSPVAVTGVSEAKVSVVYVAQYPTSLSNDVTLQVSTDYVYGNDPTTATWTQMSASYPNTSGWSDWKTVETSLNDFIGQNVTVAIKYVSNDSQSRTIEIQSITVQEGNAGGGGVEPPTPGQGEGSGTAEDPYNVAAGISLQGQNVNAWVHGYIVGAVKSGQEHNTVTSNDDIDWSAPFGRATNVLIADDASCHEIANCLIVKMPSGSVLRSQVNLVDHPDNLGKQLTVFGTLKNAFGQSGLDSPGTESDFVLEGGDTPTPPEPGTGIFSETFENGQGDFVIKDVSLPSGLTYVWTHVSNYKCMKANAYYNGAKAAESWLVSPYIDLTSVSSATLTFDHAANFASPQGYFFVMVSTDYTGDVTTARWTELDVNAWPDHNSNWAFVTATLDLSGYVGQNVTIAFKYTSTDDHCGAWEVKNVVVE
jgi:hypothetical protein